MNDPRESDIQKVINQEKLLVFRSFDESDAWALGNALRLEASKYPTGVTIDIRRGDDVLFFSCMPGATAVNADWARRKRNLVNLMQTSSYLVGLEVKFSSAAEKVASLDEKDYAWHGGCFPIRVIGEGIVATATISGLPQRDDHKLVSDVIAAYLGVDLGDVSL
jgi:uncharacterized protein (UPF0303 family)